MNNLRHSKRDITPLCGIINRENNLCRFLQVSDNSLLVKNITEQLASSVLRRTKELNINPDSKEVDLFAVLAKEGLCGSAVNFGEGRNGIPNVSMGRISFPG